MIYVTGSEGNLGRVLVLGLGFTPVNANICDKKALKEALSKAAPTDVLINCAAVTDVDECELDGLRARALHVNSAGVANLKDEFPGRIIHISTDFVFDGTKGPYDEKAEPNPINWYGQTKYCGEQRLLEYNSRGDIIVRTTVLFGGHRGDFATTVLRQLRDGRHLEIPNSIFGNPTHVLFLAKGLMKLITVDHPPKIINIAGTDVISRYDFAVMIARMFGYDPNQISPIKNAPGIAKRPKQGGLKVGLAKKLNIPLFSTLDGLHQLFLQKGSIYGHYPTK